MAIELNFEGISQAFQRMQVSASVRAQIYDTLAMLLDNNVLLVEALQEMHAIYSEDGKKPNRPAALMLWQCRMEVAEGRKFSSAIEQWVSPQEAELIRTGEQSGKLREAFTDAMELIGKRKTIFTAVAGGAAYPAALFIALAVVLYIVATKLAPALESIAPADSWTGSAKILLFLAAYVQNFGIATVIGLVALLIAIAASFPRLRGNPRFYLDKAPPWSIYRQITGALWLLNVAVLVKNGTKLHDALTMLSDKASPYLRERVDAAILGTTRCLNLGDALAAAEYDFPDREAVRLIRLLANKEGFDIALARYARTWIDVAIKKVQTSMRIFFYVSILAVGGTMFVIVTATQEINTAIENSNRR